MKFFQNIVNLRTLTLTFVISLYSCISFGNLTDSGSIQKVLDKDKQYFLESQKEIKAGSSKFDALTKYVKSLRDITDNCIIYHQFKETAELDSRMIEQD
ncbi:hypothetical protein [Leptospira santarosai]|uniref:hypothetical protein n=1 Tax=Leptospira santarosai TaxID=28183 RepID=UPI000AC0480A|nr:hypothetical protein [Leptospira santarosai]